MLMKTLLVTPLAPGMSHLYLPRLSTAHIVSQEQQLKNLVIINNFISDFFERCLIMI